MLQDTWALKAQREGYRSRAVYKLEEILVKVKYNNQSCKVLDIGCAPGGWSDYLIKKYPKSSLYGIDLLDIKPVKGLKFFREDICNIDNISEINNKKGSFDLVISDLAPNLSGIRDVDESNVHELNLETLRVANSYLNDSGTFIVKTFQNTLLKNFRTEMENYSTEREIFSTAVILPSSVSNFTSKFFTSNKWLILLYLMRICCIT